MDATIFTTDVVRESIQKRFCNATATRVAVPSTCGIPLIHRICPLAEQHIFIEPNDLQ